MTWFPDMGRESMVACGDHVRAIGWLSADQPYTRGQVPPEFLARLRQFADRAGDSVDALFLPVFGGFHTCDFCREARDFRNFGVPSGDVLFVAPAMVLHYVERHEYRPPDEFINAVAASALPGTPEYRDACSRLHDLHQRRVEELIRRREAHDT